MPAREAAPDGTPRQVFGAMLRYYRLQAGLTQGQLAALAHVSGKLVSAYENGWRVPTRATTMRLDAVPDLGANGALTELWDQFERSMNYQVHPDWFQDWSEREAAATRLRTFEPNIVPGLLQTEEYARAIFRSRIGLSDEELDDLVTARLRRQAILSREKPPEFWVIIDESVLHRPVGGAKVMSEQVISLIDAADRSHVVIRVIPLSVGAHLGLLGAFALADFVDATSVGYREAAIRGLSVCAAEDVASLDRTWATLGTDAERRAASISLLEKAAKSWTSLM